MSDHKVKITVLRTFDPQEIPEVKDLPAAKNLPACEIHKPRQEFIVHSDYKMPEGFCHYAWYGIHPAARMLLYGGDYP